MGSRGCKGAVVHPRLRGEHRARPGVAPQPFGSSPLTRGTPWPRAEHSPPGRFIPAYAGNTYAKDGDVLQWAVHPRLRGEHDDRGGQDGLLGRFIPAYAGNTHWCFRVLRSTAVHPRLRGEHRLKQSRLPVRHGSSPLTRGTLLSYEPDTGRFTVHPRLRGEHQQADRQRIPSFGSSPLTRGTQKLDPDADELDRFIPAYAGNTWSAVCLPRYDSVHPRLRGEHRQPVAGLAPFVGSSPLTRGTQTPPATQNTSVRFIPAYAGNT